MIKLILGVIVLVILGVVSIAATRPDEFVLSRSIVINAPVAKIFSNINNLHAWNAWSPWAKLDPNSKASFTGPDDGVGASMRWESQNSQVGIGTMTISQSTAFEKIALKLEFEKPMAGTNVSEFTFKPSGIGTEVTWKMTAPQTTIAKIMGVIFNCEKMVGDMFDKGLASLKDVSEK